MLCIGALVGVFTLQDLLVLLGLGVLVCVFLLLVRLRFSRFFSSHGRFVCHIFAGATVLTIGLTSTSTKLEFIMISVLTIVCFNLLLEWQGIETSFDFRYSHFDKSYYRTAAAWLLGVLIAVVFFPLRSALAATMVLTVGDPVASFVGRRFGHTEDVGSRTKTLQGSIAFLISSFLATSFLVPLVQSFAVSLVGMFVELVSLRIDDNFTVPISAAFACSLFH
jgi:dolichol kinase